MRPDEADPADHRARRDQRAERGALAEDEGDRDAGQHTVGEGVTEEAHPAQHDPRADHRCRDDGEQACHERVAHEPVVDERLDPPRPRVGQPRHDRASTISRASVDSRPRYVSAPDSAGPSESVNSVTTSTSPTAVGEGLGLDARVLGLGEDGGHVGLLDEANECFEVGGIRLGERRWRRDDGAEHLETVMLGEVPERLVVGHQHATFGRKRVQESPQPRHRWRRSRPGSRRGRRRRDRRRARRARRGRREALAARRPRASDRTRHADRHSTCSGSSLASGVIWSAKRKTGVPCSAAASIVSSSDSSSSRPLATIRSASSSTCRSRSDGSNECGSPPIGMTVSISASPSHATLPATSAQMLVVATITGASVPELAPLVVSPPHAVSAATEPRR